MNDPQMTVVGFSFPLYRNWIVTLCHITQEFAGLVSGINYADKSYPSDGSPIYAFLNDIIFDASCRYSNSESNQKIVAINRLAVTRRL